MFGNIKLTNIIIKGGVIVKKVIGVISVVLFIIVMFQSCAAGLSNAISSNNEVSGSAGVLLAFCMLIGGIILLLSKSSKGITITSIIFYAVGGLIGIANAGSYSDLKIWSALNLIFVVLLVFHIIKNKEYYKKKLTISENKEEQL